MKVDLAQLSGKPIPLVSHKPPECRGCPAYGEPGPVWSDIGGYQSVTPDKYDKLPELVEQFPTRIKGILLGEAPGEEEVEQGKGFVGPAGRFMWKLAKKPGLARTDVICMNVAKCITKNPLAWRYCWTQFTSKEVNRLPKLRILALGEAALRHVLPEVSKNITAARGCRWGRVFVALHPSGLRRALSQKEGGDGTRKSKQDLTPTLPADISAFLEPDELPEQRYQYELGEDWVRPEFVSSDIETAMHLDPRQGPPTQIGFGYGPGRADSDWYSPARRMKYQEVFNKKQVVWQNAGFDIPYLEYHDYQVPNWDDTLLGAHLLHGGLPANLAFLNSLYVHYPPWKKGDERKAKTYHPTDLDSTWQIWYKMKPQLEEQGLWSLYQSETKPVTRVCMNLQTKGVRIDRELMAKMKLAFTLQARKAMQGLEKLAPGVNWNSSQEVIQTLYGKWKLPAQFHRTRTKGIWGEPRLSASYGALEHLLDTPEGKHPGLRLLMYYRFYQHQISTYCELPLDDEDRYHPSFTFTTFTGRVRGDVLLTIPQTSGVRRLIVGDQPGWKVGYADWERVENWVGALDGHDLHFQEVLEKYNIHRLVGKAIIGREIEKGTREYEDIKRVSHGIPYGRSAKEIAKNYQIPEGTAQSVIDWYHSEFRQWALWRKQTVERAERDGYLTNAFGYTMHFWSGNIRGAALAAFPQSEVAHMIKRVLIQAELQKQLTPPARIMMPLHDAVVFTCPEEMEEQTEKEVYELMHQSWPEYGGHRFGVEMKWGKDFDEASRH